MAPSALTSLPSATEMATAIREGKTTAEASVDRSLGLIRQSKSEINAFVDVFERTARRQARQYDAQLARGAKVPPFAGVPLAVKDQNFIRFHTTRFGSTAGIPVFAPFDDVLVKRMRQMGFVIVGATSLSEYGAIPTSENFLDAPARNPWNTAHSPGGSSAGSAAAVAAGLVPIAHGADGGGSLRIPAAFCGLFTVKVTRGLLPNVHGKNADECLYTDGAMGLSVRDVEQFSAGLSGGKLPSLSEAQLDTAPSGLKIRVCLGSVAASTDSHIAAQVQALASKLSALGHQVSDGGVLNLSADEFLPIWQRLIADIPFLSQKRAHPITAWFHREGRKLKHADIRAIHVRAQEGIDAWFGDADIWVLPTTAHVAPPIGLATPTSTPERDLEKFIPIAAFTAPFNVSGQPAASVPMGENPEGLPIGVQLVAKRGQDALLFRLCRQLEATGAFHVNPSPYAARHAGRADAPKRQSA